MDNRISLINALHALSSNCLKVAKLLEQCPISQIDPTELLKFPNATSQINLAEYHDWPCSYDDEDIPASSLSYFNKTHLNFDNCQILELSLGKSIPIGHNFKSSKVDLISNNFQYKNIPENVSILNNIDESSKLYDLCIIHESLEFTDKPINMISKILNKLYYNGKIFIRFRPWTSHNGHFSTNPSNKAFQHLTGNDHIDSYPVLYKVNRPISSYTHLINKAGLELLHQKIHSTEIPTIILRDDILSIIINNTWENVTKAEAIKILQITNVDMLCSIKR